MRLASFFVSNLIMCIAIKSVNIIPVSADVLDLVQICKDGRPDGTAILESYPGGPEVLAIFKQNSIWLVKPTTFMQYISTDRKAEPPLIDINNSLDARGIFYEYPSVGYKRIVSFYGLKPNHSFYNNILIFHAQQLLRYRVYKINVLEETGDGRITKAELSVTLSGKHRTDFWQNGPSELENLPFLYTVRGTRLLAFGEMPNSHQMFKNLYVLNAYNLEHPVILPCGEISPHDRKKFAQYFMFYLSVPDQGSNGSLGLSFMRRDDGVCLGSKCVSFREVFLKCRGEVVKYSSSFAYWLYHDTEMTMRLLVYALHAMMACNLAMAIIFVSGQISKIFLLT